jgi:hypothetical protein
MSAPAAGSRLASPPIELVALRARPHAVRCREIGSGLVTLRGSVPEAVAGSRLTVTVARRWTFRRGEHVAGVVLHCGFSLRALQAAGLPRPACEGGALSCPGGSDPRLHEALAALAAGAWTEARPRLEDVLEDHPACLIAHSRLGELFAAFHHETVALAHFTAAIRLALGALSGATCMPLSWECRVEQHVMKALMGRADILAAGGHPAEAEADLRRALAWDPTDVAGAAARLERLHATATGGAASPRLTSEAPRAED